MQHLIHFWANRPAFLRKSNEVVDKRRKGESSTISSEFLLKEGGLDVSMLHELLWSVWTTGCPTITSTILIENIFPLILV